MGCDAQAGQRGQANQSEGACTDSAEDGGVAEAGEHDLLQIAVECVVLVRARLSSCRRHSPAEDGDDDGDLCPLQLTAAWPQAREKAEHGQEDHCDQQRGVVEAEADLRWAVEAGRGEVIPPQCRDEDRDRTGKVLLDRVQPLPSVLPVSAHRGHRRTVRTVRTGGRGLDSVAQFLPALKMYVGKPWSEHLAEQTTPGIQRKLGREAHQILCMTAGGAIYRRG